MDLLDYILIGAVILAAVIYLVMFIWGRKYIRTKDVPQKVRKKKKAKEHLERSLGSKTYDWVEDK